MDDHVTKMDFPAWDLCTEIPLFCSRKSGIRAAEQVIHSLIRGSWLQAELHRLWSFDQSTYIHSVHVAIVALMLAERLEYKKEDIRNIVLGALLHDVGKERIPLSILNRPGKLTAGEFALIKNHPSFGEEILRQRPLPLSVFLVVWQHHERWNGQGYPDGLRETQIHPYAQVVAVADVYDALTAERPYRGRIPGKVAYERVLAGVGTDFSDEVIEAFRETVALFTN